MRPAQPTVRGRAQLLTIGLAAAAALVLGAGAAPALAATCGSTTVLSVTGTVCGVDFDVIGGSYSGEVGTFSISDPGGFVDSRSASIDWGDGSAASAGAVSGTEETGTITGSHAYAASGVYTVAVTGTASSSSTGLSGSATGTATATVWQVAAEGQTNPGKGLPQNAFTIFEVDGGGTMTYDDNTADKHFNGQIQCASAAGNRVMIVASDAATGNWDRTIVEDNGSSGDRLTNAMFNPTKNPSTAKLETCSDPTGARMPNKTVGPGDAITVFD
jgi:hypothetical protein